MYRTLQNRLIEHIRAFLSRNYQIDLENIAIAQPPSVELGEYALTFAFELAKKLRKPPRKIAEEVVAGLGEVPGFSRFEIAGAGYINAKLDRGGFAALMLSGGDQGREEREKVMVEHTSINPNKAAHIGHVRNSILGDTFVRLLRLVGHPVDVQNYIDNTGVQVADVVVGFRELEKKSRQDIQTLIEDQAARGNQPFDYYCWDLYARVSQWYEQEPDRKKVRLQMLHEIEAGTGEAADIADLVSTVILRRHLETMQRLTITYDFLPRESEILRLHFWDAAFRLLKEKGVVWMPEKGKKTGCWVMRRPGTSADTGDVSEDNQEVLVRSNGTVTYVGKDIAYHLWKFGLLGRDFEYRQFYRYPDGQEVWISAEQGERDHPHFGGVAAIYNVIDARQADAQNNVMEAIRQLGFADQALHYTHFSYEMVTLTPRCAAELGYELSDEERSRAYIEVSGRKGFGVKADDLIDALIRSARAEVDSRHPELSERDRLETANQIAIGALRYFMLKFTKNSVIAFDFKDALSFEGETGPYCQYAVVRAGNIFRKAEVDPKVALQPPDSDFGSLLQESDDIWSLWLTASQLRHVVEQCIGTAEPAYLAKYAFQLAQQFNNFYHKHHILTEANPKRKAFLLATTSVVRRELVMALAEMGISCPQVM